MDDRHARRRRRPADPRHRPFDGYRTPSAASFARLIDEAVATLPAPLLAALQEVELSIEDVPTASASGPPHSGPPRGSSIAGGTPGRAGARPAPGPPARIRLYRRPMEARAATRLELAEIVRETVRHELAQHLGIDDDGLGWG